MGIRVFPPLPEQVVVGPNSAVSGDIAVFSGVTGALIADSGVKPVKFAVLQNDFPKVNQTFANMTDLTLNLTSGRWYRVTLEASVTTNGGSAQFDFAGGNATATGLTGEGFTSDYDSQLMYPVSMVALSSVIGPFGSVGSTDVMAMTFTIRVNAGGTLIPRFAQLATNATPSTVLKYSTITAQDVTP